MTRFPEPVTLNERWRKLPSRVVNTRDRPVAPVVRWRGPPAKLCPPSSDQLRDQTWVQTAAALQLDLEPSAEAAPRRSPQRRHDRLADYVDACLVPIGRRLDIQRAGGAPEKRIARSASRCQPETTGLSTVRRGRSFVPVLRRAVIDQRPIGECHRVEGMTVPGPRQRGRDRGAAALQ